MGTKRLRAGVCGALKFRFEAAKCLGSVVAKRAQPRKTRRYRQTIRPRDLAVPGPNLGVGVRHALFPSDTLLGASLSRAVCFPTPLSAALRISRSHGGTVPTVSDWNLSSEVSSPRSVASCRKQLAGRGADTPAIPILSRRHHCHGDGSGFWLDVGPALRV